MPWKRLGPMQPKDITVGVIWDDDIVHPHPPVTRGLRYAVDKLKAAGLKLVDFEPFNHAEGMNVVNALYFPDAAEHQKALLAKGGEPILPLTEWAFSQARPEPLTIQDNWNLNVRRENYRAE